MISSLDKLHYSFCGELTNNISLASSPVSFPKLALFKVDTNFASNFWSSFAGANYKDLGGITFVDDLVIKKVEGESLGDIINNAFMGFIAPYDFVDATSKKRDTRNYYYDEIEGELTFQETNGQSWFKDQPHLISHTTFQLFFLDGMLGTYNLGKMNYTVEQGKVIVKYLLVIKATPSGVLFKFQSGEVSPPIRWNLAVKGGIVTMRIFQAIYQGQKNLWQKIKTPLLKIVGGIAGGAVGGPAGAAAGSAAGSAVAGGDNKEKPASVELNRGVGEAMGFANVRSGKATEEQHTNRMVEQVGKTSESISDPTLYYTNNIDYHFNFFDFWMRLSEWDRILTSKIVFSSVLFNNLKHNNNINPITYPLNITFEKLGYVLKPGYWKGELVPDYDPNNRMAECFARGVTFYKDKKEHFVNPDLGVSQQHSYSLYSIGGIGDTYTAQAITEGGESISVDIPYTAEDRGYSHTTFIRLTNPFVQDDLRDGLVAGCGAGNEHYYSEQGFCWGCTYDGLKAKGFASIKFTPSADCSMILKLDKNSSAEKTFDLKAGVEYDVTISETQFIFKSEGKTRIEWQKQPTNDDFSALDWTPPPGSGGDIEIPLEDPEIALPEPGEGDFVPEDDFTPDTLDISGGEVEIPQIEIDLPPDITQDLDNDQSQDPDPPPIDIDHSQDQDNSQDQDQSQDTGDQDRGSDDPPPPDNPDDDPDGD